MRDMQQLNSNTPSDGAIRIAGIIALLKQFLRRIRLAPRPRYSLSLALLMSILQNAPVADTRQQVSIAASITPRLAQEIAGSGARDQQGQQHLLHRVCFPFSDISSQANTFYWIETDAVLGDADITRDTSRSAQQACGEHAAYLIKTPVLGTLSAANMKLIWVTI